MINRILTFLKSPPEGGKVTPAFADKQLAAAALMVEAALLDGRLDASERATIRALAERRFGLSAEEADTLIESGMREQAATNHLLGFTRTIKERFDEDERVELMDMLWDVAYADGVAHDYEAGLMRRIAGLIYVSDRDNGAARKRAMRRAGIVDSV